MLGPVFGVGGAAAREVLGVFGVFGVEAAPVVVVLVRDVEAVVVGLDVGLVVLKGSPRVGVVGGLPDSRMGERTETLRTEGVGRVFGHQVLRQGRLLRVETTPCE